MTNERISHHAIRQTVTSAKLQATTKFCFNAKPALCSLFKVFKYLSICSVSREALTFLEVSV